MPKLYKYNFICPNRWWFWLLLLGPGWGYAQTSGRGFFVPADSVNKPRVIGVTGFQLAAYGGSLGFLITAWYDKHAGSEFHSFNDNGEWLQMDKAGHLLTSWYVSGLSHDLFRWSGISSKRAAVYGFSGSVLYMTGLELLDGFSDQWGFSWGDMSCNLLGSAFRAGQILWEKDRKEMSAFRNGLLRLGLKISYHESGWAPLRPEVLGSNMAERMLKDYNGQTYWLSANLHSFMQEGSRFPRWLNVAVGYGGEGMISGHVQWVELENGTLLWTERYRQWYLSPDIDLMQLPVRSPALRTFIRVISFIKFPMPALEWSKKGGKLHWIYF